MLNIDLAAATNGIVTNVTAGDGVYLAPLTFVARVDFSRVPYTHFRLNHYGRFDPVPANGWLQLALYATPAVPLSAAGDDLALPDTGAERTSGWLELVPHPTSDLLLVVAVKASAAAKGLLARRLSLQFAVQA